MRFIDNHLIKLFFLIDPDYTNIVPTKINRIEQLKYIIFNKEKIAKELAKGDVR